MEEIKLPPQLPQAPPELPADMVSQIDKFLSNPLFAIGVKGHVEDIQQFIKENAGEFEPLVYDYIKSKYPNIFAIIQPEDVKEEVKDEGDQEEPEEVFKPVPQSEINFQIWQMHLEGYSATEIADHLSDKFDRDIYAMHVGRQISRMKAAQAQAQTPKPKLQEAPEVKNTLLQATRTQTPAEACTTKPAIDPDMMLVVSSAASLINFWNRIKVYVLMSIAATAGYILK